MTTLETVVVGRTRDVKQFVEFADFDEQLDTDSLTSSVAIERGTPIRERRYALGMLTIAYAFNFIDRQILVVVQDLIKQDMGLSDTALGLLSGFAFALVYITAGIPIARAADRCNRRNIVVIAVAIWSGMTVLSGFAQNYIHLLLARIGVGIGEAGGSPPAHSMISDYFPAETRGTALGIYSAGLHFGNLLGLFLGGATCEQWGWRATFMLVGAPGVIFSLIFLATVAEPIRGCLKGSDSEISQPTLQETFVLLSKYRSFWYLAAGCGLLSFAGYGNGNFMPSFLMRCHGLQANEAGIVLAISGGSAGLMGTFTSGLVADRLGSHDVRWYLWVPALAPLGSLLVSLPCLLVDNIKVVAVLMFIMTSMNNTYLGPCLAISHTLVPSSMRALTSAILFFVLNLIGLGLGPFTCGWLSDMFMPIYGADGLRYAMIAVSGISSIGSLLFFLASRRLQTDLDSWKPADKSPSVHIEHLEEPSS